jgi:hypothetical protein
MEIAVFVLYIIAMSIIGLLLYSMLNRPTQIKIYNENPPPPASFRTEHWGYAWRPWWRKYEGVPGLGKPLPEPEMPVAPKPIVINTNRSS